MSLAETIAQELEQEAVATRRLLERLPEAHLSYTPHVKSRSLGQLAMHVALNPASVMSTVMQNPADTPDFGEVMPTSTAHVVSALDDSVRDAAAMLRRLSDADLHETWHMRANGVEVMAMPRIAFIRTVLLNHWYHHRGQLTVYLRELDVPLPSIYGPTADENPFA